MKITNADPLFRVETISQTPDPQRIALAALRQDYSEEFIYDEFKSLPCESDAGELVVKHLLKGNRGHYGPLEHPQIILNFGYFPHSTMAQVRTHRNVSFDVESFRYSGKRIIDVTTGDRDLETVFYLRPPGTYTDRNGDMYEYTEEHRESHKEDCKLACMRYRYDINQGLSEEHARGLIPFDVRQHWVMSGNARAIMHLLDIRGKYDVQMETRIMTEMLMVQFEKWMPEVAAWYKKTRWRKGTLAP